MSTAENERRINLDAQPPQSETKPKTDGLASLPKGITRKGLVTRVNIKFTLPKLYEGVAFQFAFKMARAKARQSAQSDELGLTDEQRAELAQERNLDELCDLLIEPPTGFDDFPADGQLAERIRAYFSGEGLDEDERAAMKLIVNTALTLYYTALAPRDSL